MTEKQSKSTSKSVPRGENEDDNARRDDARDAGGTCGKSLEKPRERRNSGAGLLNRVCSRILACIAGAAKLVFSRQKFQKKTFL